MSIMEVKARVEQLGDAWEQFKQVNDRRLNEVEKKGSADALTKNHLANINNALNEYKGRMDQMEAAISRPVFGASGNVKNGFVSEHSNAFSNYLRKGVEGDLCNLETKALSVNSDPDGGYLVSPHMSDSIIKTISDSSPMRQLANVETISSDSIEVLEDRDDAVAGWATETGVVSDTDTPELAKKTIVVHELFAQPKATQKLIDDAAIDIEAWLAGKVSDIFSQKENAAFISGDGLGKPRGILTYDAGTSWGNIEQVNSGSSGAVTSDSLIELFYSLKESYATRASFLMNRATIEDVRQLKDTNGQYLWNPGLAVGAADTLLGVAVHQAADMPVPSSNSLSVAVGDFNSAYMIVDRAGVRILRDPFTDKPFVKFYTTKRVGGDVVNFEAIKLLKLA